MLTYADKIEKVLNRQNPERVRLASNSVASYAINSVSDVESYIKHSMNVVPQWYTERTKDAGRMVKEHLANVLDDVSFQYQGSVTTDTHIRGVSDIDLIVFCDKFYGFDFNGVSQIINNPLTAHSAWQVQKLRNEYDASRYTGNMYSDLKSLRRQCEVCLSKIYAKCDVEKPKAIRISNQNLSRDVDIVVASWHDDVRSIINDKPLVYRGVQIFNKVTVQVEVPDYPFLSIERINTRSASNQGRLKKMIRFIKNLKADSELKIELSSYDINAICYAIPSGYYSAASYLDLVYCLTHFCYSIVAESDVANNIKSVDEREYIFRSKPEKMAAMRLLYEELLEVYRSLTKRK